jgi:hypothetical protein
VTPVCGAETEMSDEPHVILLPGKTQMYECSECGQLFLFESPQRTTKVADGFIEHLRVRHSSHYKFPIGVRVGLAKIDSGKKSSGRRE